MQTTTFYGETVGDREHTTASDYPRKWMMLVTDAAADLKFEVRIRYNIHRPLTAFYRGI